MESQQGLAETLQPMNPFDRRRDRDPIRGTSRRGMHMVLREIANRDNTSEHLAPNAHNAPQEELEFIVIIITLLLATTDEHHREVEERNGRERALDIPQPFARMPLENRRRYIYQPAPRLRPIPSHTTELESPRSVCSVCLEAITGKSVTLDCGTKYDIKCLKRMFDENVNDENRFPPRCCGKTVDLRFVKDDISEETLAIYQAKIEEYGTTNRLYCSNARCAQFLGGRQKLPAAISCSSCNSETCVRCNSPAHKGTSKCKIDPGLRSALMLGEVQGWQRCPRCRQLVERTQGCYHMSCRCGAQFCYVCATNWPSCECNYTTHKVFRRLGLGWVRKKGRHLLDGELGAREKGRERVVRLCRRSWESAVKVMTPRTVT